MTDRLGLPASRMAILLGIFMGAFASAYAIPFNVGAILVDFDASRGGAGSIISAELFGSAVASLIAARFIGRISLRMICIVGGGLVLLGNLATFAVGDLNMLLVTRALVGLGVGTTTAGILAIAASSKNPEMTFGVISASAGIGVGIISLIAPQLTAMAGYKGLVMGYTLTAILSVALAVNLKLPQDDAASEAPEASTAAPRAGLMGWSLLFGLVFIMFAYGGFQGFVERIGVDIGWTSATVGLFILIGAMLTIVGPIAVGAMGVRFGTALPIISMYIVFAVLTVLMATTSSKMLFAAIVPVFWVLPIAASPLVMGALTTIDPSGRLLAINGAFALTGAALGPAVIGGIADSQGYGGAVIVAVIAIALATVLIGMSARAAERIRSSSAEAAS